MPQLLCIAFITALLTGCAGRQAPKKADDFADGDSAVMICCPLDTGFACDWLTEAEDGHEKMVLAHFSKSTGAMSAVCPLPPSA